jgi:hypothetical protein
MIYSGYYGEKFTDRGKAYGSAYQNLGAGIETGRTGIRVTILPAMQVIRRK